TSAETCQQAAERLAALDKLEIWDGGARDDVSDLRPLADLVQLKSLGLYYLGISRVGQLLPLYSLPRLRELSLRGNMLKNVNGLAVLTPNLRKLTLNENPLSVDEGVFSISEVSDSWQKLEALEMVSCQLAKLPHKLPLNIKHLDIQDNPIVTDGYATLQPKEGEKPLPLQTVLMVKGFAEAVPEARRLEILKEIQTWLPGVHARAF
ncbi:hypothetical protein K2X33_12640, partial [bacterium]|nr:hypothetical protein [bacterium]